MAGLDKLRRDVYVSSPIYLRGNRPRRFNIYTDDYN